MSAIRKPSKRTAKRRLKFFNLEKWFDELTPKQQNLLQQSHHELSSADFLYSTETAGQFLSSCATKITLYDIEFAEQLFQKAIELEANVINLHYILMSLAGFYKNQIPNPEKWLKTIQEDLALLPDFARTWKKQERTYLAGYPALDEMLHILQSRGDLPEALSLCKAAVKLGVAGAWESKINELKLKMQD